MNYSSDKIKLIAREFLNAVHIKTNWKTNGVVVDRFNNQSLILQAPGWSKGTEEDDNAKRVDPVAQKRYEDYLVIEDKFNKKYPGMRFSLAGGASGERVAKMDINKEIIKIANSIRLSMIDKVQIYETTKNYKGISK